MSTFQYSFYLVCRCYFFLLLNTLSLCLPQLAYLQSSMDKLSEAIKLAKVKHSALMKSFWETIYKSGVITLCILFCTNRVNLTVCKRP